MAASDSDLIYDTSFNSISESSVSSFSCVSSLGLSSARSSISNDKSATSLPCNANKPHKANDAAWEAMRAVRCQDGPIGMSHFRLMKKVGSGDIGKVYTCQLRGFEESTSCVYAMKVVDKEALVHRNKLHRAEVERQILSTLDHPFLPTLYAHFDASRYSCLVMEYCSAGDLHSLRQRQRGKRFCIKSARFYAAEVVVALEYLHMMGVIYRDLKPENVLVREDGHIMLSDFDLSFRCEVVPTMRQRPADGPESPSSEARRPVDPEPVRCWCFFPWSARKSKAKRKGAAETPAELVAEPTEARSKSFVGTHEYLAPEVITGKGHGSAVDWWTLGIFLYEMLVGSTPFKGPTKEATLVNIITHGLRFPGERPERVEPELWESGRDLIRRLLNKDPRMRLGSNRGSGEVKRHPFFKGVNWALIRSTPPAGLADRKSRPSLRRSKSSNCCERPAVEVPPHFDYF